jgi:hypothetical protein
VAVNWPNKRTKIVAELMAKGSPATLVQQHSKKYVSPCQNMKAATFCPAPWRKPAGLATNEKHIKLQGPNNTLYGTM